MEKIGGFVTTDNEAYISNKIKGIRFIDTPGCNLNGHGVEETVNRSQNEINKQYNDKNGDKQDPSNYVSIIWYCFSGTRFGDQSDVGLIKQIRATYPENQILIIIVRTEAYDNEDSEKFKNIIQNKKLGTDYIGVVAKEKYGVKKKIWLN